MSRPQVYFWQVNHEYGYFSNWHLAPHKMDGVQFQNSEQSFMALKAATFDDFDSIKLIYNTPDPKEVKRLGRQIKNFDEQIWEEDREYCMYMANFYKFTQNPKMLNQLLNTGWCELIEASPVDKIWGSGWDERTHRANKDKPYPGLNLLGKTLEKLRDDLLAGTMNFDEDWLLERLNKAD